MQLDKLFSIEEQNKIGGEMRRLYFDEGWSKEQLRLHYKLTHDTLKEFARKYSLVKSSDQYNKKGIDRKFSKEELDELAENIRIDFCDNLLFEYELEQKYNITFTDLEHIKKRYNITETVEQHWKRTQRANMIKHGVSHMSHIEGSREKATETYKHNYVDNEENRKLLLEKRIHHAREAYGVDNINQSLEVQLKSAKTIYGDKFKGEKHFYLIREALRDKSMFIEQVDKIPKEKRTYRHLSEEWQLSEQRIYEAFKNFELVDMLSGKSHSVSRTETYLYKCIKDKYMNLQVVQSDRQCIYPQELDIYMPEIQFAIEVNGSYWHCDKNVNISYHQNKSKLCMEKGIQLFHAFEKDLDENFDNVFDKICCLIDMLIRGSVEASSYYECDFCEDNGAALIKNGYILESLSTPDIRYKFGEDNVYDAGKAIFRKVE